MEDESAFPTDDEPQRDQRSSDFGTHSSEMANPEAELEEAPVRPPGPGIFEAFGWIGLFFVLQIAAMLFVLVAAMLTTVGGIAELEGIDLASWLKTLDLNTKLVVFTSPAFLCYLVLVPLGLLRLAPRPVSRLNLNLPTIGQTLVAASLVLPLTMVADGAMKMLDPQWQRLVELVPSLQTLNNTDVHKMIGEFGGASFWLTLFFIAVVPAFGEEFLFRGLIGRGLVARWGLIGGVGITSFLFAAVHMYPPHVLAIIPVGIALHWIYLTTQSFWAPVLFHFLNNGIAVVLMRANQADEEVPAFVIPIAVVYFIWCLYWLYKMRTIVQTEQGPYIAPRHEVEVPEEVKSWRLAPTFALPVIVAVGMLIVEIYAIYSAFLPQ